MWLKVRPAEKRKVRNSMVSEKFWTIWGLPLPFGAEEEEEKEKPKDEAGQQNSPDSKPPEKKEDSDDEDNPYAGLSAKELRRIISDTEQSKKDVEAERDSFKEKVDEAERATKTKEENLENDVKARDATISTLRATNAKLAIINGILMETKWRWHNPEIVAQQLDSKLVKVTDDGKVDGLQRELARVAKDHSYLLVKGNSNNQGSTGIQPGQGSSPNQGKSPKDLAKDYPALLGRI